ncbi:MFS transporter [Streptomyces xanthophaeus]|uniref:MFS transporter n=1 Tax=Streptomyces xanthophaeus TaxID=67385 RepID=UPI0026479C0B|nr:MFS transporter [Streptomyces xanthophaeus]WKD34208.1 MFS transporter [Streptomyces xanthophaeus]
MSTTAQPIDRAPSRAGITLLAACLIAALLPTSITGTSVTLPAMGADLGSDLADLQWVVNAYDLTFASFLLACGSLSDIIGRRRMFLGGMTVFALCSLIAGAATDITVVDIVRGIAGIGAAAVITSASSALANAFDGAARARAFGFYGTCFGIGLAFGPLAAGALTSALDWRWFFYAQAIIAVVVIIAALRIPEGRNPEAPKVDWAGTFTFTSSLFLLILALVEGPQIGWAHPVVLLFLAGSALLLAGFVLVESRSAHPMFDLGLFRQPQYVALCVTPVALAFGFVALLVFLPSYFMAVDGISAADAGLLLLLLTAPTLVMPAVAGYASKWLSPRALLVTCMTLVAAGTAWLTVIEANIGVLSLAGPLLVIGIGFGISNGVLDGAAVSSVEPHRAGMAAGMFNTMRITGEVIAIAAMGSLMVSVTRSQLSDGIGDYAAAGSAGDVANQLAQGDLVTSATKVEESLRGAYTEFASTAYSGAMHEILWVLSAICLVTVPFLWVLCRPRKDAAAPEATAPGTATESPEPALTGSAS